MCPVQGYTPRVELLPDSDKPTDDSAMEPGEISDTDTYSDAVSVYLFMLYFSGAVLTSAGFGDIVVREQTKGHGIESLRASSFVDCLTLRSLRLVLCPLCSALSVVHAASQQHQHVRRLVLSRVGVLIGAGSFHAARQSEEAAGADGCDEAPQSRAADTEGRIGAIDEKTVAAPPAFRIAGSERPFLVR